MGFVRISMGITGVVLSIAAVLVAQEHSYTQADIDAGSRIYDSSCGGCHGENGDKVVGVDFSKGEFKTARNDDDIVRIIRNGVPNTAMPSNPFSEPQARTIVAFVRSMLGGPARVDATASALPGDAARGKAIFEGKGNCLNCHAINTVGATIGPDLGQRGGNRGGGGGGAAPAAAAGRGAAGAAPAAGAAAAGAPRGGGAAPQAAPAAAAAPAAGGGRGGGGRGNAPNPQQIERSIVDPNAEIAAAYRVYRVVTRNGTTVQGTLLNQDTFSVQLRDNNDRLLGFVKSDLREFGFMPSPMPSYKERLTAQEIADVVSYLISVRSN